MQTKTFSTDIGGKEVTAEFTDLADQAHGSVLLRMGDTTVLATAVMSDETRDGLNYFPLTVDYEEKFYAAGAILGSRFMRREGRPSEEAVLSGRVVDRTIRPLFDHNIRNDVQVVITVLSLGEDDPDVLAVNAASLALATSDIPWGGPVSAVRVGKTNGDGEFIINPAYTQREDDVATLDLLACGKDGNINMIEVGAQEVSEDDLAAGLSRAVDELKKFEDFQKHIVSEIGKEKRAVETVSVSDDIKASFESYAAGKLVDAVFAGPGKAGIESLKKEWLGALKQDYPDENASLAAHYFEDKVDELLHTEALENGRRPDGRGFDEVRPLYAQAGGVSPMLHGSGIFYRGGTHILSALTLGGPDDSLIVDTMEEQEGSKRFMHHYNFPPFSVGETGRIGGFNRRMIGHGALAEKALKAVIPPKTQFPYTIRLVSEAMASNGSTSMGSVCGSTLALMDGGVPIKRPVAGIAMGLMSDGERYKILTDIQGPEDHHGDMDFKVAGTREGVTAVQMDVKVDGVPVSVLSEAFAAAKKARLQILDVIEKEISEPRANISPNAPEIITLSIKPEQIGSVIGPGGKVINGIKDDTGVSEITIDDDGSVFITGKNGTGERAAQIIRDMTREYKAGERFDGEVTRFLPFGAFVRINNSTEGLVHVSEIASFRVESAENALKVGQTVPVVIKEIDEQKRINLSIKDADPEFAEKNGIKPAEGNGGKPNGPRPHGPKHDHPRGPRRPHH